MNSEAHSNDEMNHSSYAVVSRLYIIAVIVLCLGMTAINSSRSTGSAVSRAMQSWISEPIHGRTWHELQSNLERNRVRLNTEAVAQQAAPIDVSRIVKKAATRHRLDPALVKAVMHVESLSKPSLISEKGATGFMQLMPATARRLGVRDLEDPEQNIYAGAKYLRSLLDMFGNDLRLALAAYNAGPSKVRQYNGVPPYPETEVYITKVMDAYSGFRQLYS